MVADHAASTSTTCTQQAGAVPDTIVSTIGSALEAGGLLAVLVEARAVRRAFLGRVSASVSMPCPHNRNGKATTQSVSWTVAARTGSYASSKRNQVYRQAWQQLQQLRLPLQLQQ